MSARVVIPRHPKLPRLRTRRVAFDTESALKLGQEAVAADAWRYYADHGGDVAKAYKWYAETEAVVAIASPIGVVAVWYARANAARVSLKSAALAATESPAVAAIWATVRSMRLTHVPLACAAARLLHARTCGEPENSRDKLLAEWFGATARPETQLLLQAPEEALLAASALRIAGQNRQAINLLKQAVPSPT